MAQANQDLIRIVEEQGRQPVGIPVLLFTDATLDAGGPGSPHNVVQESADELGYDLAELQLFSTESYLVQTVAGRRTVGL